jgi:hypothetical protein
VSRKAARLTVHSGLIEMRETPQIDIFVRISPDDRNRSTLERRTLRAQVNAASRAANTSDWCGASVVLADKLSFS